MELTQTSQQILTDLFRRYKDTNDLVDQIPLSGSGEEKKRVINAIEQLALAGEEVFLLNLTTH